MSEGDILSGARPLIYQLFVRHFSNAQVGQVVNGTLAQNGCGKFNEISSRALGEIAKMGFNVVWLTGVLEHACGTDYPNIPAENPILLKGRAGSPYAVKDYFDVSPDYAEVPEKRLEEFRSLVERCHAAGMRVVIDFIPNHVARSYGSDVRPELDFGGGDDVSQFFASDNNFYYLEGDGVLRLPAGEYEDKRSARVTGNNANTWSPSLNDWYETVKLNYGHDYRKGRDTSHLPGENASLNEAPDTWRKMDAVVAYWQEMGVDGFRADMAHMVPMEFWRWVIHRARGRRAACYFMAEGYDGDPAKLTDDDVLSALLDAGFDTVYDGDSYELVKELYVAGKWANDFDRLLWDDVRRNQMLRYAENHDEVRIASKQNWGGHGAQLGKVVTALLAGVGPAPFMLYNGQEVGERADGSEGFSGDDGRSSIFDYTCLPHLQRWWNDGHCDGGKLTPEEKELRQWYAEWFELMKLPVFARGGVYGLNSANRDNPRYGRLNHESTSGHWLFSFLRHDQATASAYLVVINFHPSMELREVEVLLPEGSINWLTCHAQSSYHFDILPPMSVQVLRLE